MRKTTNPFTVKKSLFTGLLLFSSIAGLQAQQLKPEHNKALLEAKQGAIVKLPGFLSEQLPSVNYQKFILPGPQYLISDDPEYIRVPEGIALKEPVQPGSVRLYVYNVNGIKEPAKIDRKITAVIKNTGKQTMHLRMLKYSSQPPSTNYNQIGKQGLADYFASQGDNKIKTIAPGEAVPIDEKLEKYIVKYDELVHGIYEFVIDQPAEISVLQTDPKTPGPQALNRITGLLPSRHTNAGRGVFGVSNYEVIPTNVLDTKNGAVALTVADGVQDEWVQGKMNFGSERAKLAGNYGVMYNIDVKWKSSDGKGMAVVTWNARSEAQWCDRMATSMVVNKGKFEGRIVQLPNDRDVTTGAPEAVLIQVYPPSKSGEEQIIKLTYSPPGASCLPTPLIFIPVDFK